MIPTLRRQKIVDLLQGNEILFLADLVAAMGISESTVRRDLKELAHGGDIELLRGGGVRLHHENVEMNIDAKLLLNREEKDRIAKYAAGLIYPGDIVFLDPSSVNYLLIDHITAERVTVVTNSIANMNKLLKADINCVMIGGQIKKNTSSCVGAMAERMLRELRFSKSFLGANGMSVEMGMTNHDPNEQSIKRLAIEHSVSSYFLIDSSKYGVVAMCKVADIGDCMIITDKRRKELDALDNIIYVEEEAK
jgi:DeoR family fructose operon transcriptional repressor